MTKYKLAEPLKWEYSEKPIIIETKTESCPMRMLGYVIIVWLAILTGGVIWLIL